MNESWTYTNDLLRFAAAFRTRQKKQIWRETSLSAAEKMLFVGFYFVRKLIECRKVADACARRSFAIGRGTITRKREVSDFLRWDMVDDLDGLELDDARVDVQQIADCVIHAWWLMPVQNENAGLRRILLND